MRPLRRTLYWDINVRCWNDVSNQKPLVRNQLHERLELELDLMDLIIDRVMHEIHLNTILS
jgi:hypothetical protein